MPDQIGHRSPEESKKQKNDADDNQRDTDGAPGCLQQNQDAEQANNQFDGQIELQPPNVDWDFEQYAPALLQTFARQV